MDDGPLFGSIDGTDTRESLGNDDNLVLGIPFGAPKGVDNILLIDTIGGPNEVSSVLYNTQYNQESLEGLSTHCNHMSEV